MEAVALRVRAASMRPAVSGNRPAAAEAVKPAIAANPRIHADSSQRSRRTPSRTMSPVPARLSRIIGPPWARGGRTSGSLTFSCAVVPQEQVLQGWGRAGQGVQAGGLPVAGSLAFGLGWAATGMAFSAIAGVSAQLTTSARAATGLGITVIAITYVLRAVGDLAQPAPSALSWLSPIVWNQQIRAYAGDQWWVLALPLALCAFVVPAAFMLRARRDLGGGLRQERPGAARGALGGAWDLAVRLQNRVLVAWAAAVVVFGVVIGSLASSVTHFLTSPNAQDMIKKLGGAQALTDAFLAAEIAIMGILVACYGLSAANHLRSEETAGHTEALLGTATTRTRWVTSHYAAALAGVALLMLLTGLSTGAGAAFALHDAGQVGRVTVAALAQIPAAWVITSAALTVFGWVPRLTTAVWGLLAVFIALGEFGVLWNAPQWLMDLSPFQHTPLLPVGSDGIGALAALTATAATLAAVGYLGWSRRDLTV